VALGSPSSEGDWQVVANAYRASRFPGGSGTVNITPANGISVYDDPRVMVQQAEGLTTLSDDAPRSARSLARHLNDTQDDVSRHIAIRAIAVSRAHKDLFAILDADSQDQTIDETARKGALRALAMIHTEAVVDGLITRLDTSKDPAQRRGLLSALCRLHFTEGEWKGDSWGTRPDTRGPYYQPEAWTATPKIAAKIKDVLAQASPADAAFLVSELNRNRIQFNEALDRILVLASRDSKLIPDAVGQLANADTIPAAGIPLLISAASTNPPISATVLSQAIAALTKSDNSDGVRVSLNGLVLLGKMKDSGKEQETARTAFLGSPKLENHHQLLEAEAEKLGTPTALWADAALLTLSARKTGSPESRELTSKALENGWQYPTRRTQILKAVAMLKHNPYADKVLSALDDPDKAVAAAATHAAKAMKLERKTKDSGPLIGTMKPEDVLAQVLDVKGDIGLGEQLYTRQTCVACHTVREDEAPKGPYLGNIAQTYKRGDLALAILEPNKTIAQGFATEMFTLKDGSQQMGFVTLESAEQVKIRNIASQEFTYAVKDITKRDKLPVSMMPPGLVAGLTVRELASLLDYLEALSKK
jgi:putative heme-binding domain-containing protein